MTNSGETLLDAIAELPTWARPRQFGPDEVVFREGSDPDSFHIVTDGRVKLLKTGRAESATMLDLVGRGGLLCGNATYRGAPYCCTAVFDGGGGCAVIVPRERLLQLVDERRGLWRPLMDQVTCRGMMLCERVDEVGRGTVQRRLARLFVRLFTTHGERRLGEAWLPLRLSRRDLAQLCCTRVETVIRAMSCLERDGLLRTADDGFYILDLQALFEKAGLEGPHGPGEPTP